MSRQVEHCHITFFQNAELSKNYPRCSGRNLRQRHRTYRPATLHLKHADILLELDPFVENLTKRGEVEIQWSLAGGISVHCPNRHSPNRRNQEGISLPPQAPPV